MKALQKNGFQNIGICIDQYLSIRNEFLEIIHQSYDLKDRLNDLYYFDSELKLGNSEQNQDLENFVLKDLSQVISELEKIGSLFNSKIIQPTQ